MRILGRLNYITRFIAQSTVVREPIINLLAYNQIIKEML